MKRWIVRSFFIGVLLLFAHVIGSYGTEFVDAVNNYDLDVPFVSRLDGPIRVLPLLLKWTFEKPNADIIPYWIGYLFPTSVVVGGYVLWRKTRPRVKGRAFPVEMGEREKLL